MTGQIELPLSDSALQKLYKPFEIPPNYPAGSFKPEHPAFNKFGEVHTGTDSKLTTFVDLRIGECECKDGFAFRWDSKRDRWFDAAYCIHKMRMLSSIVSNAGDTDKEQLQRAYLRALSTRYNQWDTVSAFHKELRRGDFEQAWFWALILSTHRGVRGVFRYMLNIIYEETRDHDLALHLIATTPHSRYHNLLDMARTILWFCRSTKKWELPTRFAIFDAEMQGYSSLVKSFGKEVAGHGNIINKDNKAKLYADLSNGYADGDLVRFQRGLKGLQKLQYGDGDKDLQAHRYEMYETMYDIADTDLDDQHPVWTVISAVNARIEANLGIGYHELNAIGDSLMGEPLNGGLSPAKRAIILRRPQPPIPLAHWPAIPLYSHDNHTYKGKALMRKFPEQLKVGAEQTDLDFRYCGAYFGVGFRTVAFRQHGEIAPWHTVVWPKQLFRNVEKLWY